MKTRRKATVKNDPSKRLANVGVDPTGKLVGLPPDPRSPADFEPITPADYKREREQRGTQVQVAAMLGVHPVTIAKRETGAKDAPITREAWLAMTSLPVRDHSGT
jgi:hypothetical protein